MGRTVGAPSARLSPLDWGRSETLLDYVDRLPWRLRVPVLRSAQMNRVRGPFAFQSNPSTRRYEYPWAFHEIDRLGPSRILEVGGALSGLQFVLAKSGYEVHNVDPFFDYGEGEAGYDDVDPIAEHAALNRSFGTDVTLHRTTLPAANVTGTVRRRFVHIWTIEHLSEPDVVATLAAAKEPLAPPADCSCSPSTCS